MKLVSFNIRRDNFKDGINNFDFRKGMIIDKIKEENPDLIAFQEVLPHVMEFIKENLPDYTVIGRGRGSDFKEESVCIAVKDSTMEIEEFNTFWLSPTPDVPGSRFKDQSVFPRICSHAIVRYIKDDFFFRIYNTHLDHIGEQARFLGIECVLERMRKDSESFYLPVILSGDFNEIPKSRVLELVRDSECPQLFDLTKDFEITYHDYYYGRSEKSKIDYIFASKEFKLQKAYLWDDEKENIFLSDHYPICIEVTV